MKSIYDSKEYKTKHQWGFSCKNPTNRQVLAITINVGGQDITVTCDGVTSTIMPGIGVNPKHARGSSNKSDLPEKLAEKSDE